MSAHKVKNGADMPVEHDVSAGHTEGYGGNYWAPLQRFSAKLERLFGFETQGIQRVESSGRSPQSYWALCLIWASGAMGLGSFTIGFLGPAAFQLDLGTALAIIWCFGLLGSSCAGYVAVFGKRHGLRTLANARFTFGWYGSMICAILNIMTEGVFNVSNAILGGQTIRAISQDEVPVWAGIVIISAVAWILAFAGYRYISYYERVAWILPAIVFISLYAVGGQHFSTSPSPAALTGKAHGGMVLSYIALVFGAFSGWLPMAADYYVYFPLETADWKIFTCSTLGIWALPAFALSCGAGFASALHSNAQYAQAYAETGTVAGVIEFSLRGLGNVRYFFLFVLAWTMVAGNIFNLYSMSLSLQVCGSYAARLPHFVYATLAAIVTAILAIVGKEAVDHILSNLLAVISFWTTIFFVISLEEHVLFRKKMGYLLEAYNDKTRLGHGMAAMTALVIGGVGAALGMSQSWYRGPVAKLVAPAGGDIGIELAMGFCGLAYPILRWLELRILGNREKKVRIDSESLDPAPAA